MRFDNIASAANTPGGFQAGVNDIIQAVMGAKRDQAQQAFQQSQMDQQQANLNRSFGADQAQRLSSNSYRERELAANETRAKTDQEHSRAQDLNMTMDNLGAVGKYFGDKFLPNAAAKGTLAPGALTEYQKYQIRKDTDTTLHTQAMNESGIDEHGQKTESVTSPKYDIAGRPIIGADGKPVTETKLAKRIASQDEMKAAYTHLDSLKHPQPKAAADSQFRHEDMPGTPVQPRAAGGTPGLGAQVAQTLAPQNTGDTNGLSQNEPAVQAPAIDYVAEDAKLQATNPQYRQLRANPQFNWKGAVEKAAAMRAQQPR